MSAGVASGGPWASWGRPGRQVDGLSRIFVSRFGARSRCWFLSQLLAANWATLEQDCAVDCHSLVFFPLVAAIHCPLTPKRMWANRGMARPERFELPTFWFVATNPVH